MTTRYRMSSRWRSLLIGLLLLGCSEKPNSSPPTRQPKPQSAIPRSVPASIDRPTSLVPPKPPSRDFRVAHVVVVLCDNTNQAIAPVPAELGNGQQPRTNLYWGALYGLKTFFDRSAHWKRLARWSPKGQAVMEGVLYRYKPPGGKTVYLIAEAWDGTHMPDALKAFFDYSAGRTRRSLKFRGLSRTLPAGGSADWIGFVGHDGLMDNPAPALQRPNPQGQPGGAIVLACQSKAYFGPLLGKTQCPLQVGTMGNMAPEAYTLDAALRAWADGNPAPAIRSAAAAAYAKYQKCSLAAARRLFDAPR